MQKTRAIIVIDEAKCTGCGLCILACAEGALALVDGKAKTHRRHLLRRTGCLGIGECPEGALKVIERPADAFDETAWLTHVQTHHDPLPQAGTMPCGCPSSAMMSLEKTLISTPSSQQNIASELSHWPVKLQLLGPQAPFLKDADLLLLAPTVWPLPIRTCTGIS